MAVRRGMVSRSALQRRAGRLQGFQHPDNLQSGKICEIRARVQGLGFRKFRGFFLSKELHLAGAQALPSAAG